MSQFTIVCVVLHLCLIMVIIKKAELSGEIQFFSPYASFWFNDALFHRFAMCMLNQYKVCTGMSFAENQNFYTVFDIQESMDKEPEPELYIYHCNYDSYNLYCSLRKQTGCKNEFTYCRSNYRCFGLETVNINLSGDNIKYFYNGCLYQMFYYIVETTTTSTTQPSTTTRTTKSVFRTTFPTTKLTTKTSKHTTDFQKFSTTKALHENSSVNLSGLILNNDKTDENTSSTITISACVVSAVCLFIVSSLGIFFWRRHRTNLTNNCNDTKLENRDVNSKNALNSPCDLGNDHMPYRNKTSVEPPDLLKTGHKHTVKIYSNCVVEGEYTSIGEEENNSAISMSLYYKTNIGTQNAVETDIDILSNTKRDCKTDEFNVSTIQDTSVENNQTNNALYINTNEKANSEYQRLGQERRDIKNPYQQLLQVEQEQQLVQSDQELSPYTLAKPVLGEATLQVIDVGAWVDNSCDTARTTEDQPYNNTLQDVFTPQREPSVDIKHDRLGYTMVMDKQ